MLDNNALSEEERQMIRYLVLQKQKESLESEIEELKLKGIGLKNGKASLKAIKEYFKDWGGALILWSKDELDFFKHLRDRHKRKRKKRRRFKFGEPIPEEACRRMAAYFRDGE